jgi:hypothetical protein
MLELPRKTAGSDELGNRRSILLSYGVTGVFQHFPNMLSNICSPFVFHRAIFLKRTTSRVAAAIP